MHVFHTGMESVLLITALWLELGKKCGINGEIPWCDLCSSCPWALSKPALSQQALLDHLRPAGSSASLTSGSPTTLLSGLTPIYAKKLVLTSLISGGRATGTEFEQVSADSPPQAAALLCDIAFPLQSWIICHCKTPPVLNTQGVIYILNLCYFQLDLTSLWTIEFFSVFLLTPHKDFFLFITVRCYLKVLTQSHHQR